ncbi:MAG: NBR1-Ig-like domain-containing protein [Anaerolineales bacterium]|nr:NBR1-Ig-like domain-containing protein [Anaerolineales bacterium]MCS7247722.1 NBR1-Ig-like domain-containing protein [Anaerolineales bacterium]MDW8161532.1 NBR1-Ig-like domain-containing protein [Anaerolineales bacterium]MDW8446868.1 NBR1-Ig-like domain-containing protein [Anaerolineales bacterium]
MRRVKFLWMLWMLALSALACRIPSAAVVTEDPYAIYTQAAATVQAMITEMAGQTAVALMTEMAQPPAATPTPVFPTPEIATFTPLPSPTPIPPIATPTSPPPPPTPVPPSAPCDLAQFVSDVTIPDGTILPAEATFTKIWRVKNVGTCTWTKNYALRFVDGADMGARKVYPFNGRVSPGEVVDIAVELTAPGKAGDHRSFWMLANEEDKLFGVGAGGKSALSVKVTVVKPNAAYRYDLASSMCLASWKSSAGDLPCPGNSKSASGSVILLTNPKLEDKRQENEPTLWTRPPKGKGSWIQGVYPAFKVKNGDHFVAEIGCLDQSSKCKVTFTLQYQVPGNKVETLGEWNETDDGKTTIVDVDLSFLADKQVKLILTVTNNVKDGNPNAFWFVPSVRSGGVLPTRTPTPTATSQPTNTPVPTATATPTVVPSPTPTATGTATPAAIPLPTATP